MSKQVELSTEFVRMPKWVFMWDSRAKLLAATFYIFGVISLQTPIFALIAYTLSLAGAIFMGVSFNLIVRRYLLIAPFLLLMTIPLLFGGGWPIDEQRISFVSLLLLKATTSMTVMTILLQTQSVDDFMTGLANLKVPPMIITVLLMSFRYVFLFLDDIQKMQLAVKARYFTGGFQLKHLKVYGQLTGSLLIRSFNRSDQVYEAMSARCFNGTLRFCKVEPIQTSDVFKMLVPVSLIILLLLSEQLYIRGILF